MYHELSPLIKARYIRFLPQAWVGHISMRVELYGCQGIAGFLQPFTGYSRLRRDTYYFTDVCVCFAMVTIQQLLKVHNLYNEIPWYRRSSAFRLG